MKSEKAYEGHVRRIASQHGYMIRKSRSRSIHANDLGDYMLVDRDRNFCIFGERFNASLEDIEKFLTT